MSFFKIFKRICALLWWLLVIATVALLIHVLGAKIRGQVPQLFGYSVMQIITGSMEPELAVGDYILVRECDPSQVQEGDIISFYSREYAIYGLPNTHRVAETPVYADGSYTYITKGDSNLIADELPVNSEQLIGVYAGTLEHLSAFSRALDQGLLIVILALVLLGVSGMAFWTALRGKPQEEPGEPSVREPENGEDLQAQISLEKEDAHGQERSET